MIPSYSRMTTLLFWCLLAASLLAMVLFEFGPERRLDILSQAGLSVRAQDDRAHKGSSVATLSQGATDPPSSAPCEANMPILSASWF